MVDSTGAACGPAWNIEDTLDVFSFPFGNGLPVGSNAPVLAHTTATIADDIKRVFGESYSAVAGTDDNPLVFSMNLQNQTGGRVHAANLYFELSKGKDRANTDFVIRDCASCGYAEPPEWSQIICAQNNLVEGCPDPATAPIRASLAAGFLAWLDTDPCYDGATCGYPRNRHLAAYDGQTWWTLTEGLFPGSGTFTLYDNFASMKVTIRSTTFEVEYTSYNQTAMPPEGPAGLTVREYSIATIPRAYLDHFDVLHAGMGTQCQISGASANPWGTCVDANANWRTHRCRKYVPGAGRPINDDFVLYGGEPILDPTLGACCLPDGRCTQTSKVQCQAEGGFYQGDHLPCGTVPCFQACSRSLYADDDGDGDVDMDDFAAFQRCFNAMAVPTGCGCFDRGRGFQDGRVDLADFAAFTACATGTSVPFLGEMHPDCPPHPGLPASPWMHENFESYPDAAAFDLQWPIEIGLGFDLMPTGGNDGPQCITGAKTFERRNTHDLVQHIQVAPGGAGRNLVNGTDDAPLVFEAAYRLDYNLEVARQQDFFWDLARDTAAAPRGHAGTGIRSVLAFGAFTAYHVDGHQGMREGLMYYTGQKWLHLTSLSHGPGWNYLMVKIRTSTVEITYYDEFLSNGMQTVLVPRTYLGGFDKMAINSDICLQRVGAADGFKLSGGVFLP